ncbi:MAG: ABC transporter permease [Hydrogenophaga sp.]|uniref:MlaE family ABC transporter permease n=1 Tax=Hydrogenophaga sp. TaxID=1904254 RepID=UPI00261514D9|nr:ABC transporter permease [Hydrogenophaga sp.]MDM7943171.1 ABC transporter permease [Hydrogenophaga sp.]
MNPVSASQNLMTRWGQRLRASWVTWWQVVMLGAQILVTALTPSSYARGARRQSLLLHIYQATAPLLTGFLVLSALISLVLIRIVVATAYSYGLSQYALEVLVRTLVLELIPLYAAMFVAARYAMPGAQRVREQLSARQRSGQELGQGVLLTSELLPRALASVFSVLMLAALSCVIALVLTYLTVYGFSPWGLPGYTRSVGQVFTPAVTLIFTLKTLFFSLAVAVVPLAGSAQQDAQGLYARRSDISEFARLFSVVLLIEIISLVGNYY